MCSGKCYRGTVVGNSEKGNSIVLWRREKKMKEKEKGKRRRKKKKAKKEEKKRCVCRSISGLEVKITTVCSFQVWCLFLKMLLAS